MTSIKTTLLYFIVSFAPLVLAIVAYEITGIFIYTKHEPFIIAGLTGTVTFGTLFLKRTHDVKVVRNAFKADLKCFSNALGRLIDSLPDTDDRVDQIANVNITSFSHMDIYNKFIDKVGLLDIEVATQVIDVYAQLKIFVPASTLVPSVNQTNEHRLVVSREGRSTLKNITISLKERVDRVLTDIK